MKIEKHIVETDEKEREEFKENYFALVEEIRAFLEKQVMKVKKKAKSFYA